MGKNIYSGLKDMAIVSHQDRIVYLLQVVLQLSQDDLQLIDFARQRAWRRVTEERDRAVSLCMNTQCIVRSLTHPASRAAPSAAATRLVSSREICSASALCMSVMVQNEATRWSGHKETLNTYTTKQQQTQR